MVSVHEDHDHTVMSPILDVQSKDPRMDPELCRFLDLLNDHVSLIMWCIKNSSHNVGCLMDYSSYTRLVYCIFPDLISTVTKISSNKNCSHGPKYEEQMTCVCFLSRLSVRH